MKSEEVFVTNSFEETQTIGEEFAKDIARRHPSGVILIALHGELGSGKTTFVKGLAKGLGIQKRIISPTFVFIRQYQLYSSSEQSSSRSNVIPAKAGIQIPDQVGNDKISSRQGTYNKFTFQARRIYFYHVDLYRIKNNKDIGELGLEEIKNDPQNIVVIEWAEKMGGLLPEKRWDVTFEYVDGNKRRIIIKKFQSQNSKSETISKFK